MQEQEPSKAFKHKLKAKLLLNDRYTMASSKQLQWVFWWTRMTILYLHYCVIYPLQVVLWERHKRKSVFIDLRQRPRIATIKVSCCEVMHSREVIWNTKTNNDRRIDLSRPQVFPNYNRLLSKLFFLSFLQPNYNQHFWSSKQKASKNKNFKRTMKKRS